jgi:hypothetical protein
MVETDQIETVAGEPMIAVDRPLAGLPNELPAQLAAELAELIDDAERYAAAAQALNTTRAYASDWHQFTAGVSATGSKASRPRPPSSPCTSPRSPAAASPSPRSAGGRPRSHAPTARQATYRAPRTRACSP